MKRFIITIILLIALVGSVFGTEWVKKGTYENSQAGIYNVYYDLDAVKPFENDNDIILYTKYLKTFYSRVAITIIEAEDAAISNDWYADAARNYKLFATLEEYENYVVEDRIYSDGSVLEIICWK